MKKLLLALLALLIVPAVHAAVDVTYVFNQNNVEVSMYNCLDASCSQVAPFSGSIIKGPSATDGKITIRYPDSLATPFGYAGFFVSKGYRPLELRSTRHTGGAGGLAPPITVNAEFTKYPIVCRAVVSELNFVNELAPNMPLVVNTTAKLDASTASAFQLTDNDVNFIPPQYKQEYYGADTIVKMEVLQSGSVVHSQQKEFSAVKGNALIADSAVPVQFTYLPSSTGDFTVKVTAQVVDDQCASTEDQSANGAFSVLASTPSSQFYTILNGLTVNNTHPRAGQPVMVSYNKITNHADGVLGPLTPVQTDVVYTVKNGATTVFTSSQTLFANPDAVSPVTYSFVFTPTSAGVHTITVFGKANSALPTSKPEITDTESFQLNVLGSMNYKVVFQVSDASTGNPISNATVTLPGIGTLNTTINGTATFPSVPEGNYVYTVSASNFSSKNGDIKVKSDVVKAVLLHPGENESAANTPPYMNLPSTFQLQQNVPRSFNFFPYVQDDQDRDALLKLGVVGGNTSIAVDINPDGTVTFIPATGFTGSNTITFMLNDTQNATAVDSMVVTVVAGASSAPVFSAIPAVNTTEDTSAVRVLNLRDYVTDADTSLQNLVFSVISVSPSTLATARIDDRQFLTVIPKPDANGNGTIAVTVSDGTNTANTTITLIVAPVNDAPVVISIPKIPNINESTNYTLDLSLVFRDPDGDPLTYNITPTQNITFILNLSGPDVTIVPDFNVNGTRAFNITAIDPYGLTAKAAFTLFLNFVDDKPFFNAVIPNILTFEETPNSIDLTPFENDPEEGPGANGNSLIWKMQLANQSNLTPVTSLDTSLFTATINTSTDFLLIVPKANQSGIDMITLYLFDSTGKNISQNVTVTVVNVNDAPAFVNLSSKSAEAGLPFIFDINATDSDPTNDTVTFGLINVTPPLSGLAIDNTTGLINFTPSVNGVFAVNLQTCDNLGACSNGSFTLTISDTTAPTPGGQLMPPNPSIYAPGANYTFGINFTDNGNITNVTFMLGSTAYTNVSQNGSFYQTTVSDLAAGNYTFQWTAKDSANNTNVSNRSIFTVLKANSDLQLTLNGTAGNITVPQGTVVSAGANLTNTTGTVSIYNNGILVASGASSLSANITFPIQGSFNITASFAGNQNYTGSNTTFVVTVSDTVAPAFGTQSATPVSPALFTSLYNFKVNVTDNVGVTAVQLSVNNATITPASQIGNTSTWEVNLTSLSVGNHSMAWTASDAAGNVNSTAFNYTVTPGIAALGLTINGVAGNTSVQVNDTVTIVANVTNPAGGAVDLYINGTLANTSASSPMTHTTSFAAAGTIPITAVFPGDVNVSAGNLTRFLTITPIVAQANITPASGSLLNYSSFIMTLDTNQVTTCSWSFSDVAQGSMNNSFATANGLNHTANISGLGLGVNPVFVACNNQSAASNTDLVYTAVNILDGSVLIAPNSISGTIMKSSTLNTTTLTNVTGTSNTLKNVTASANSVINSSILTNCVITNSTVKDVVATDCVFSDSYVDPSNLTGSTVTASSTIVDSNVTFSTVTNSTITNSRINGSSLTGCLVANSTFSGATAVDCVILNMVISAGNISVPTPNGTFTYDANVSGPANLSAIIPVPPVANFVPLSGSTAPGTNITFTSTSTDANIPGPLNDSLTFFWDFGDGTNATGPVVSKAYNATGTYTIMLTATDSFGFTSTKTGTHTIAITPPFVPSSGGGGGGGGGGGSSGLARIPLSETPVSRVIYQGSAVQFTINGKLLPLSATLRRVNFVNSSTEWVINGVFYTLAKGQSRQFDLTRDKTPELDLTIGEISRNSVTITAKLAGTAAVVQPPLPAFNFTPTEPEVVNQPEEPVVKPVEETEETTVPVTADVEQSKMQKFMQKVKDLFTIKLSAKSAAVKAGIVIAVVLIGLIAYALFVRWESF
ncbi:MAG: PKD domain-containing protein [Candidatus Woesearchaeota archaeon]